VLEPVAIEHDADEQAPLRLSDVEDLQPGHPA
jgi:hypothetical protein